MNQTWQCACCGEQNETWFDPQAGQRQRLIEDCRVCCRPNVITATYNHYTNVYDLQVYQEDIG